MYRHEIWMLMFEQYDDDVASYLPENIQSNVEYCVYVRRKHNRR